MSAMKNAVYVAEYPKLPYTVFFIADIIYAATPPNQLHQCILIDYFNNSNFRKTQIIRSLTMVIKPNRAGAVLM
jgi:hypothetical protein